MKRSHLSARFAVIALLFVCFLGYTPVHGASQYMVQPDDKLKIKIFQYPELSGEYTVSTTGTIMIAPIGELSVGKSTTKELAALISDRFIQAGLSDKPGTTVEILQSRPIYVMGDVQKPGEFPFRPGITVLQAISLAGGYYRSTEAGLMRLERDAIHIQGDMRSLVERYYHLTAQRSRLNAELALNDDINFPPELVRQAESDPTMAHLVDEERSFLSIHMEAVKKQLESLEKARTLYEREIDAVLRQIQANTIQHDSVAKELSDIKALYARGLAPVSRKMNLERTQAQVEMTEQGFQTLILRARQGIAQIDQKIFDLKSDRNARITAELQRTRLELADVGIKFDTNKSLLVEAQVTTPTLVSNSRDIIDTRTLAVVRVRNGKSVTLEADDSTELLPGDVLKVQRSVVPSAFGIERPGQRTIRPTSNRAE